MITQYYENNNGTITSKIFVPYVNSVDFLVSKRVLSASFVNVLDVKVYCDKTRKDMVCCRQMEIRIVNAYSDCFTKQFFSSFLGCSPS